MNVPSLTLQRDAIGSLRGVLEALIEECGFSHRFLQKAKRATKDGKLEGNNEVTSTKPFIRQLNSLIEEVEFLLKVPGLKCCLKERWEEEDEVSWVVGKAKQLESLTKNDLAELRKRCQVCIKRYLPMKQRELLDKIKVMKKSDDTCERERFMKRVLSDGAHDVASNQKSEMNEISSTIEESTEGLDQVSQDLAIRALGRICTDMKTSLECASKCDKKLNKVRSAQYLIKFETERADLQHRFEQSLLDLHKWSMQYSAHLMDQSEFCNKVLEAYSYHSQGACEDTADSCCLENAVKKCAIVSSENRNSICQLNKKGKKREASRRQADIMFSRFSDHGLSEETIKQIDSFLIKQGIVAPKPPIAGVDRNCVENPRHPQIDQNDIEIQPWCNSTMKFRHRTSDPVRYRGLVTAKKGTRTSMIHGKGNMKVRRDTQDKLSMLKQQEDMGLKLLGKRFKQEIRL